MNNHQKRHTVTDRSGAILSNRSRRRRRAARRARLTLSIDRELNQLSHESLIFVYGAVRAMIDENNGKLSPDDAAQYVALRSANPLDIAAIEAWLNARGYLERENRL